MKKIIITLLFIFIGFGVFAQESYLKNVKETQDVSEKVTLLFKRNRVAEAFDTLQTYWPLPENELESIEEKTIRYLNILNIRFGRPIGFVKVKNETILDFAIKETYFIRYEHTAIRLIFMYYKNDNGWIVHTFKWDDLFFEEFD